MTEEEPYFWVKSKVFSARKGSLSMKGTIPSEVVEDLQLGDGDVIEWELVKDQGGKIEARVRRAA